MASNAPVAASFQSNVFRIAPPRPSLRLSVCLVGGPAGLRDLVAHYLNGHGVGVDGTCDHEEDVRDLLPGNGEGCRPDAVVLLVTDSPAGSYVRLREAMEAGADATPVVVISKEAQRAYVYGAVRMGAKGFVTLNCPPEEIVRAIQMAAEGTLYLAPTAMELLTGDLLGSGGGPLGQEPAFDGLSAREIEVVRLLCDAHSTKEIARHLHLSSKTVENHRYNIYRKCGVENIVGLLRYALRSGLISL